MLQGEINHCLLMHGQVGAPHDDDCLGLLGLERGKGPRELVDGGQSTI
jgi:hypothetical protein